MIRLKLLARLRGVIMYNLIVTPFKSFIGVMFEMIFNVVSNYGISLIILSIVVNIILFPFYHIAEKIEKKEKDVQARMKPKLDEFKSVYKGYELHLYTNNVYRLNGYHPAYALRGLVSLAIQIPFFMGAYAYLSAHTGFDGVSFLMIQNLALPDGLLRIGSLSINVLPFVMTAINLASGYIYSKGSSLSEKLTIVGMAVFFLVLLYNSPASLLIYWTFNNVFSLVKSIVYDRIETAKGVA